MFLFERQLKAKTTSWDCEIFPSGKILVVTSAERSYVFLVRKTSELAMSTSCREALGKFPSDDEKIITDHKIERG